MEKYPLLHEMLLEEGIIEKKDVLVPDAISFDDLELAHSPEYIQKFKDQFFTAEDIRRLGIPPSEEMITRWRYTVNGTVDAARRCLTKREITGNISGGYHHAHYDSGRGYCAFNDTVIAIRKMQKEFLIERALVIDLDVHQGDGTASILNGDPQVYTFSMHAGKNFPMTKAKSTLDVELADKMGDDEYLSILDAHLEKVLAASKPDIVFYLAGVDVMQGDRLGRLSLTLQGLKNREEKILKTIFKEKEIPLCILTAGGYAKTAGDTAQLHLEVFRSAYRLESEMGLNYSSCQLDFGR
eukprot:TRINITY_DN6643_c0_g1_i1.p1 TRINITY_DN6643_c0_g1~~TRINITY_DN6643_c0_g1_i1.p1  ORF type:complete len:336 (-),score=87.08 TRINITY_DN6643_c0_g1_i1:25-915(-)